MYSQYLDFQFCRDSELITVVHLWRMIKNINTCKIHKRVLVTELIFGNDPKAYGFLSREPGGTNLLA